MARYIIQLEVIVESSDEDHLSDRVENLVADVQSIGYRYRKVVTWKLTEDDES